MVVLDVFILTIFLVYAEWEVEREGNLKIRKFDNVKINTILCKNQELQEI